MEIKKGRLIYYSPTGTGKTTVTAIMKGTGLNHDVIDLTLPDSELSCYKISSDELAVIAVPVYSGRVSSEAVKRIKNLKGNNTPAVLVAMYGNRAYEDTLLELKNLTSELGFKAIGGAAFIGQHSFSSEKTPIASGRPDDKDRMIAEAFGVKIMEKLSEANEIPEVDVPGNYPYVDHAQRIRQGGGIYPETNLEACNLCGVCAGVCPVAGIDVTESVSTDIAKCTACSACVQSCPTGARIWTHERVLKGAMFLSTQQGAHKEPEVFL